MRWNAAGRTRSVAAPAAGVSGATTRGVTERPSENRIKEALALGDAKYFIVACPKDKVMYTAAVQALGVEDRIEVRDIIDLIKLAPRAIGERQPHLAA